MDPRATLEIEEINTYPRTFINKHGEHHYMTVDEFIDKHPQLFVIQNKKYKLLESIPRVQRMIYIEDKTFVLENIKRSQKQKDMIKRYKENYHPSHGTHECILKNTSQERYCYWLLTFDDNDY